MTSSPQRACGCLRPRSMLLGACIKHDAEGHPHYVNSLCIWFQVQPIRNCHAATLIGQKKKWKRVFVELLQRQACFGQRYFWRYRVRWERIHLTRQYINERLDERNLDVRCSQHLSNLAGPTFLWIGQTLTQSTECSHDLLLFLWTACFQKKKRRKTKTSRRGRNAREWFWNTTGEGWHFTKLL